jgi:hypothetical protein
MGSRKKIKNIPLKSNKPLRGKTNDYIVLDGTENFDDSWYSSNFFTDEFSEKYIDPINKKYKTNIQVSYSLKDKRITTYDLENIPSSLKLIFKEKFKKRYPHLNWKIKNLKKERLIKMLEVFSESNAIDFIKGD